MSSLLPVPVTVVTGFLGAGKTTLVNAWLRGYPPDAVAVIVNEHGEAGIDGELLAARVRKIIEITGGCVCCSTQADLVRALERLAHAPSRPKRILVETSGAASPAGVIHAIMGGVKRGTHTLDGVVTVVDPTRIGTLVEHDLAREQVGYADIVVLSRGDLCDAASSLQARDMVARYNGAACVVTAAEGVPDAMLAGLETLLDCRRADFVLPRAPVAPSEHAYESISLFVNGELDEERFADFMEVELAQFSGRIFRMKGILAIHGLDERMIVQGVTDLVDVTFGLAWGDAPRTSRLVVVGYGLDRPSLERAFGACSLASKIMGPRVP
ncbi:MAG: GTP-binding protein [Polyangiaceae bacterium]